MLYEAMLDYKVQQMLLLDARDPTEYKYTTRYEQITRPERIQIQIGGVLFVSLFIFYLTFFFFFFLFPQIFCLIWSPVGSHPPASSVL